MPSTIALALSAFVLALTLGGIFGVLAALRQSGGETQTHGRPPIAFTMRRTAGACVGGSVLATLRVKIWYSA